MPSPSEKFKKLSREEQDKAIATYIKQGHSKKRLCSLFAIPSSRIAEALAAVKTRQDKPKIEEVTEEEGSKQRQEKVTSSEPDQTQGQNTRKHLTATLSEGKKTARVIAYLKFLGFSLFLSIPGAVLWCLTGNWYLFAGLFLLPFIVLTLMGLMQDVIKTPREQEIVRQKKLNARRLKQAKIEEKRLREEERLKKEYDAQVLREAEYRKKREENPLQGVQTAVRIILSLMIAAGLIGCIMCFAMMGQSSNGQQSDKAVSYLFYCIGATVTTFLILCLFEVLFAINANLQKKSKE